MAETIWVRGEGGGLHQFDLPLDPLFAARLDAGQLVRVNPDGSPYVEAAGQPKGPTPKERLQAEALSLGVDTSGTVAELTERVTTAHKVLAELQKQANELGLDESGTADELRVRIDATLAE